MGSQTRLSVCLFPSEKASKAEFHLYVQWVFKHAEPREFTEK
jgi:lysine/ornithine N-monooxygenase